MRRLKQVIFQIALLVLVARPHALPNRDFRVTFRVDAITYRNNATMTISNMGVPQDEGQLLRSFSLGSESSLPQVSTFWWAVQGSNL